MERVLGRSLPVVTAGGDYAQGEILIKQLAAEKLQLLIVLGTQALTLTAPKIKKTLVVFAMVADPYHSGAAYNKAHPDDHQENIIGIASPPPLEEAIRQTQKLFPAKRHWGLLYNPFEGPSVELKQNIASPGSRSRPQTDRRCRSPRSFRPRQLYMNCRQQGCRWFSSRRINSPEQYAQPLLRMGKERRFVVVNGNPRLEGKGAVLSVTLNYEAVR